MRPSWTKRRRLDTQKAHMDKYDDLFFDYVDSGALRSADIFARLLMSELQIRSLLDVGCGRGGWASRWKAAGCPTVLGVDGDYVDRTKLYVATDEFQAVDLNQPFQLNRRFDLVQSLEVAEHLRPEASEGFIANLVAHGDIVLFSAAVPGQGGTQHINERAIEFWRALFAQHGFCSYDFLRPLTRGSTQVEPWYRHNSLLYANEAGRERMSEPMRRSKVPASQTVPEMAEPVWRMRRAVLKHLPVGVIDKLAVINAKMRVSDPRRG